MNLDLGGDRQNRTNEAEPEILIRQNEQAQVWAPAALFAGHHRVPEDEGLATHRVSVRTWFLRGEVISRNAASPFP